MELCLSNQEKNFIIDGVQNGMRNDGRSNTDYRSIYLETGVLSTTNGSAKVQIGSTVLLVGVKAEMTTVEDSSACVNRLRFFADCSAIASPIFVGKGGNEYGEDLAKILYSAYDNDTSIPNIGRLVLAKTFMWTVFVDIVILQFGGSVMDAASIGVKAALADTKICDVIVRPADEGKIILDLPDECNTWALNVSRAPLIVGVNKIGEQSVIDANDYEEACSNSILFVAVELHSDLLNANDSKFLVGYRSEDSTVSDDDCRITCVRKHKGGCLDYESVEDMLDVAVRVARPLNNALMMHLCKEELRQNNIASARLIGDMKQSSMLLSSLFR